MSYCNDDKKLKKLARKSYNAEKKIKIGKVRLPDLNLLKMGMLWWGKP